MDLDSTLTKDQLRLIEEISRSLAGAWDADEILRRAARAMLLNLADLAVLVVEGHYAGDIVEAAGASPEVERRTRAVLADAMDSLRKIAVHEAGRGRFSYLIPAVDSRSVSLPADRNGDITTLIQRLGARSLIVVAMRSGGKTVGALGLARTGSRRYSPTDVAMAQVVARRIAVALEEARLQSTMRDVEQRHSRVEDAIRKWTRVFDLAGWGAAVVDGTDRRMEAVNPAFAQMHGYSWPDELTGRLFDDLVPEENREEAQRWGGPDEARGSRSYESVHLRADGSSFPVLVNVTPMTAEGSADSYVVTVQELSELKRTEERLRRAQRMEAVGRLAGGVAHEVNNMMTIILGFSDLLGRAQELPDQLQRDVEEIRKAATRAGRITQQLLAFSRQQVLQPNDLGINSVVDELAPVLRLLLPVSIRLETRLAPLDAVVRADRAQLEQVLINLAFNARDAMPTGGTIQLATEARQLDEEAGRRLIGIPIPPGRYGLFSVVDTGHGMDRATLLQVFEPFFTTKPVGHGTGLGLSSVYGIVKQSGGYVWVESTLGEGTTFTVALPTVGAEAAPAAPEVELEPAAPERGGRILVVEDEDGVRELAGRILESRGYEVLEARNGEEAVAALNGCGHGVDMVLTDVVVPDLGPQELERRLREIRPDLPILFMSGYPREDVIERRLISAEHRFLQKPFTTDELVEGVGRMLRDRREVVGR